MKKTAFLIALVSIIFLLPLSADPAYLFDNAGLLGSDAASRVEESLREASASASFPILVYTESIRVSDVTDRADILLERMADEDGIILYINMAERSYYYSTMGYAMYAIGDRALEAIDSSVFSSISSSDWEKAFRVFAENVSDWEKRSSREKYNRSSYNISTGYYSEGRAGKGSFDWALTLFIALPSALIPAFAVTGRMKRKLRGSGLVQNADDYSMRETLRMLEERDIYLYSTVSKVRRQQSSSSSSHHSSGHISSSGHTHGGRGGRF